MENSIRADGITDSASSAALIVNQGGMVSVDVELIRRADCFLGTMVNAEAAFFASILVGLDFQRNSPFASRLFYSIEHCSDNYLKHFIIAYL
jgi:hypothetical protein